LCQTETDSAVALTKASEASTFQKQFKSFKSASSCFPTFAGRVTDVRAPDEGARWPCFLLEFDQTKIKNIIDPKF